MCWEIKGNKSPENITAVFRAILFDEIRTGLLATIIALTLF